MGRFVAFGFSEEPFCEEIRGVTHPFQVRRELETDESQSTDGSNVNSRSYLLL